MSFFYKRYLPAFLLLVVALSGCSVSRQARTARQTFDVGEYHAAIQKFQKAQRKEKDPKTRLEYDSYIADAYWRIGNYRQAGQRYRNLVTRNYPDSLAIIRYADWLRMDEKYNDAIEMYKRQLDSFPDDRRAINGIESAKLTQEWLKKPTRYIVERERALSSRDADYSPVFISGLENNILFSSTRDGSKGKKKSAITGQRNATCSGQVSISSANDGKNLYQSMAIT